MQPDHEADDLHDLLHEEYGAPRLDDQFSADLIARLQAEAAPSSTPMRTRRSPLAICLGAATVAALVIAVIWIAHLGAPGTDHEAARRAKTDSDPMALSVESTESEESVTSFSVINESLDNLTVLSESEAGSQATRLETLCQTDNEHLAESRHRSDDLHLAEEGQVNPNHHKRWRNVSATVAHGDMLYVVDGGHLYEVSPIDGSRRIVGDDDWQNTAAMGAASGHLYIVSDSQLYEVNPTTGTRRSLGKPDWAETEAIVTVGDMLYIVGNGLLHRVDPTDGSHEVPHNRNDSTNDPRRPKH